MYAMVRLNLDGIVARLSERQPSLRAFVPRPRFYPLEATRKCIRHGVKFDLHPADYMQWAIFADELDLSVSCATETANKADSDAVILDIGANCGHFSLRLAASLQNERSDVRIFSFEPNASVANLLRNNIAANQQLSKQVTCIESAVGQECGTARMEAPKRNSGAGSLMRKYGHESHDSFDVKVTTVDTFAGSLPGDAKIAFIKADVEGFEPAVLLGATQTIKAHRPDLFLEIGKNVEWEGASSEHFIFEFLKERNYEIFAEVPKSNSFELVKCDSISELPELGLYNMVARG